MTKKRKDRAIVIAVISEWIIRANPLSSIKVELLLAVFRAAAT